MNFLYYTYILIPRHKNPLSRSLRYTHFLPGTLIFGNPSECDMIFIIDYSTASLIVQTRTIVINLLLTYFFYRSRLLCRQCKKQLRTFHHCLADRTFGCCGCFFSLFTFWFWFNVKIMYHVRKV